MAAQACSGPAFLLFCPLPEPTRALCPLTTVPFLLGPGGCGHILLFCRCSVDSPQGRLLISAVLPWCGEVPVHEGREEMREGSRDRCMTGAQDVLQREVCEQLAC